MARDLHAPPDLMLPAYVRDGLGRRNELVVGQGFGETDLRLKWWNDELREAGLGSFQVSVDPNGTGAKQLTRGEIFRIAGGLSGAADDDAVLKLLWHVLAWGSGTSRRNNRMRIESFANAETGRGNAELLGTAAGHARVGEVKDAYSCLIRRGGGVIRGLGPAFFTKFLYFAGAGGLAHPCLILDARVASSLYSAGWVSLPRRKTRTGWTYSANWYTTVYVQYCALLKRWAEEEADQQGRGVAADEIEVALFQKAGTQ